MATETLKFPKRSVSTLCPKIITSANPNPKRNQITLKEAQTQLETGTETKPGTPNPKRQKRPRQISKTKRADYM